MKVFTILCLLLFTISLWCYRAYSQPDLGLSDNQHYLVDQDGTPSTGLAIPAGQSFSD